MIDEILRKKIGFNIDSVGRKKIEADVMTRMRICGIADFERYLDFLQKSPAELDRLIETVTVPETWFFRLKNAFDFLEEHLRLLLLRGLKDKVRVFSIPCSTGEEPYSIAMTFLECGFKPGDFVIDAADINQLCLDKAVEGIFGKNSFRGERVELVKKYFKPVGACFELDPVVRKSVNFSRQNLLEYVSAGKEKWYDIIFCRNMLIYLDNEHQKKAIAVLASVLKEQGLLFLGHSESGILFNTVFSSVKINGCFTFIKNAPIAAAPSPGPKPVARPVPAKPVAPIAAPAPKPPARPRPHKPAAPIQKQDDDSLLRQAEQLADAGDLKSAEEICRRYLTDNRLDPRAYFLLGIVLLATRRYVEAETFFHKTLYLEPDHHEALLGMAAVKENQGEWQQALSYKDRAARRHKGAGA